MIPGILLSEVMQWYLICTLADPTFILLVSNFYTNTSGTTLGMTT